MGACECDRKETEAAEGVAPTSHPPEQQLKIAETDHPRCDCETCRHEAKLKTLVNIEPPTDANRMVTTCQISYGKGHPQYRSLMAALRGAPVDDTEGMGPDPLTYRLVRALCPSAHPGQAICSSYIPSVCPGPVYERFGPFPGHTEFQDTISSNAMRVWLASQQIRGARPPTCVCPPDPQTGSQPVCCQREGKLTC